MRTPSGNLVGACLMVCSMAAFTLNDACIKALGPTIPLFQILFLRGVLSTLLVWSLARAVGQIKWRFPPKDWILVATRTLAEIAAAYFFLSALYHIPLANLTAVMQILPLTVTLGGWLFFDEVVGWRRMSAILIGFFGILLIVRPGSDGFDLYSFYALAAVVFVTIRDLSTRRMSAETPSMTVTLVASVAITLFSGIVGLNDAWVPLDIRQVTLIAAAAVFILGGYLFSVLVMRVGEVSFIAPFRYTGLLWALLLGFLVFGHWPDQLTLLGCVIVVVSGLFVFLRERELSVH